ncbi:post-transcriptional regulator [Paenibacillus sp. M1]|uniref:Post-transcriptional regulator n=1 Tax=Paenibacillus haidiansis TaxID=1574488 RepID=A0ABU7VYP4_9BACL
MAEDELGEKQLNEAIENLCLSKAEEFRLIGYEHVTGPEIWECVSQKYEKDGYPPLYQLVNDILSLKATQFMNYMTISAFRGSRFD